MTSFVFTYGQRLDYPPKGPAGESGGATSLVAAHLLPALIGRE